MNRLAKEKSPYLLQHAGNPVDWYPWGEEAFQKAKAEDKVVFLSIGYSTCHWCHVMEHESFENEEIAKLLNANFVSVKVDREERPDLDQVYMSAVQAMSQSGGWPLTVFLTPDKKPFSGGTYFPPEDRWGRIGMKKLLPRIHELWKTQRKEIEESSRQLTGILAAKRSSSEKSSLDYEGIILKAFEQFHSRYDQTQGGFGRAPKFPSTHNLSFLLRYWKLKKSSDALSMVCHTLDEMSQGGIRDHLGGGFHRYSTDQNWLIPHFEKMLYDQALISRTYLEAFQATGQQSYADIAAEIFKYVLRDLTSPEGAFYSAEDADSEGLEGTFYVWNREEILQVLGEDFGKTMMDYWHVSEEGNFENTGKSVLSTQGMNSLSSDQEAARKKMYAARCRRVRPHRDEKIITAWNGLMISSLALGSEILNDSQWLEAAEKSARFILEKMSHDGRLMRIYCQGKSNILGFQDDYALFANALIDLYEVTGDVFWFSEANRLTDEMIRLFWDETGEGFFYTAIDHEKLIVRDKEYYDGAIPSGNSMAATLLMRLARFLGHSGYEKKAEKIVCSIWEMLEEYPTGFSQLLMAIQHAIGPSYEMVLVGDKDDADFGEVKRLINLHFVANRVFLLINSPSASDFFVATEKFKRDGKVPTLYVCQNFNCRLPASGDSEIKRLLNEILQ